MKINNIITATIHTALFLLISFTAFAQKNVTESGKVTKDKPRDNFYTRYLHTEKRALTYDFIHEKDVMWERRIWRLIDIDEKFNHRFRNEKKYFIDVLLEAAKEGNITLYHNVDEEFSEPFTMGEAASCGTTVDTICTFNPDTFQDTCFPVANVLNPEDIRQYRLKEVYFVDEETSKLDVRILGIAPIIDRYDDDGNFLNSGAMFWVYYPECREILAQKEAFNYQNDAQKMTWEDVFESRLFHSYIIKESNVYDRRIKDYQSSPMSVLLESDKIKDDIFNYEVSLWTY